MTRYIVPVLIGVIGTAILIALGIWQMQRLEWKETVLAEIEAQLSEPAVPLPATPDPAKHKFMSVDLAGTILPGAEFIFTTVKGLGVRLRVIQAMELSDGRRILVELGVVNPDLIDRVAVEGPVTLEGMLHWPDESDAFTPDPDTANGIWYARDLDALAAALETEPVLVVTSQMTPADILLLPLPLDPTAIPNDHLQYAVTWFGLAVVWVGMTMLWLRRIARTPRFLER